jgi:hypothetical protein
LCAARSIAAAFPAVIAPRMFVSISGRSFRTQPASPSAVRRPRPRAPQVNPDFSPRAWKGGAEEVAEKLSPAYNHPSARRATPPESGGELLKTLPSSDEGGWPAERRGGGDSASAKCHRVLPRPVKPRPSSKSWVRPNLVRNPAYAVSIGSFSRHFTVVATSATARDWRRFSMASIRSLAWMGLEI